MKRKVVVMAVAMVLFSVISGIGEEKDLISVDFQRVPLRTVLRILSDRTGKKLITDTQLAGREIVLSLEDVGSREALNALLDTYDLYYIRQPDTNIYVIKSRKEEILTKVSEVFILNHANAEDIVPVIENQLNVGGKVVADRRTNSVIVADLADKLHQVSELINILDTPTPQVLIEAKIMELDITDAFEMGINLEDFKHMDGDIAYDQRFAPGEWPRVSFGLIEQGYNIQGFIQALQRKTEARLLNNPRIMVLSNETASIDIVDEIPYTERETTEAGERTTVAYKDVGVQIEVTPYINENGNIQMSVAPEQSFQTGVGPNNAPIVKTSRVNTSFTLDDGDTAIIGGLIRESDTVTASQVPILGDIPILGYFFKRTDRRKERSELTVFITATIVDEYSVLR